MVPVGAACFDAYSICDSSIPSIIWSERNIYEIYIGNSVIAVISGFALGYAVGIVFNGIHPGMQILTSVSVALAVVLAFKEHFD